MRKITISLLSLAVFTVSNSYGANLVEVYQDGLKSDPTYLAAKTTYMSALEDMPIAFGALLPQIGVESTDAFMSKTDVTGSRSSYDDPYSKRGYGFDLNITQQIFNYTYFQDFREAQANVKAAAATYYAAEQDLMVRIANDYFTILKDEEIVRYNEANVNANKRSLDQAKQQYEVGLKTQTDVYTSQAAYSTAISEEVSAKNTLANDEENLRAITGRTYKDLAKLSDDFPLAKPDPINIEDWVQVSVNNNWSLKSSHYTALAGLKEVKAQFGGHLPTVNVQGDYGNDYDYLNASEASQSGSERTESGKVSLNVDVPIFSGGTVTAENKQAEYNYQTDLHNEELEYRTVVTDTRQDYLDVMSGISAVSADKSAVQSNESSLQGLEAGYKVGTQTMIDVLNQQSLLFSAQQDYVNDRYNYVLDLINLKNDAGTLSADDVAAINEWLGDAPAAKDKTNNLALQTLAPQYQDKNAEPVAPKTEITTTKADS